MNEKSLLQFQKDVKNLGITLNDHQIHQFLTYYELLIEWNEKMNLTAITDFDEVLKKHFLDSLTIVKAVDFDQSFSVIDVGTGAGFPGIPIKIAFPQCNVTLLDSLMKRIKFLDTVIETLELENIETIHGRAEDFAKPGDLREQFDLCVSRAVANLSTLSELCIPYVKVGGKFAAYKSEKASEEMKNAENAWKLLKLEKIESFSFQLSGTDYERNLVIITKERTTPLRYPRKAGLPLKQPL